MIKGEIEFTLSYPITYGHKGKDEEGVSVSMFAPSVAQMKYAGKLKQFVMQAMQQSKSSISDEQREAVRKNKENSAEDEDQITGDDFVMMLASSEVDYNEAIAAFTELLCSGAGMIDGREKITSFLINKMMFQDLESMLGRYLEHFLLQSLIQKMKSEKP